ncbi:MAG: hypothetical protein Q8R35_00005, partial [bacterium]|nr:hypothetical protein [bacterium]
MVVKEGKIYYSLREIAPTSPYSADYLRIRILQGKVQGIKVGREWYTTREWLAEYISRYGAKVLRAAAAPPSIPIRYTAERQFVPLAAAEAPSAVPEPASAAPPADSAPSIRSQPSQGYGGQAGQAGSPQAEPVLVLSDIRPPLGKTIYDFSAAPERRAASPPAGTPAPAMPAPPAVSQVEPPPKLVITRHPAHRELTAKLRSSLPLKFAAVPLVAAVLSLFLSVAVAGGITPARVLDFAVSAAGRAGSFALEISVPSPREIAVAVGGELRRVPHRLALAGAGIAALPERIAASFDRLMASAGNFLLTVAIPSPSELAAWPDSIIARLEARPTLAGPQRLAAGILDSLRNFIVGLPRPKLPERIARFFNLTSPPLTAPQANAPVRHAFEPRNEPLAVPPPPPAVIGGAAPVAPPPSRVREVVEAREIVRPADVSLFQAKLDQLNAGLRTTVNKLVSDVAGLYEGTEIKTSVVRAFSPSQSINELFDLKIDSGLRVRSGNLAVSAGDLTVTGNGRVTGTFNIDGAFAAASLGTSGLLTVSGSGTSSLAYGFTAATSGGLVGIGTTSPSALLAVGGNGYFTGGLGIGTVTTSPGGFQTTGMAVIGSNLDVRGLATSTFAGPVSITGILTANSSALTISSTSTVTTQFTVTRGAVTPHTFASWATGVADSAVTDATLLVNPASAVSDSNLFGIAIAGSPRFLVDAEGDIYARNLILEGGTTQATTTLSGNLSVEGNAALGDAANADTHIIRGATILYASSTSPALSIWNSTRAGDLLRLQSGATSPTTDFLVTAAGQVTIGTTTPSGLSLLTVGATTTNSVALTLKGVTGQTGNLFQVLNSADTQLVTISSAGLVGIASTSPGATLSVNGTILAQTGTSTFGGIISPSVFSTTSLAFYTGSAATPASVITTAGNLGIGTTSPGRLLSISGPFLAQGTSTILGGGLITQAIFSTSTLGFYTNASATPSVIVKNDGGILVNTLEADPNTRTGESDIQGLTVRGRSGDASSGLRVVDDLGTLTAIFTRNNPADIRSSMTVNGAASATSFRILSSTSGNIVFQVDTSAGSSAAGVKFTSQAVGTAPNIAAISTGSNEGLTIDAKGSGNLLLQTVATGNVGIGTTTPGSLLSISGPFLAQGTSTINGAGLIAQSLFSTTSLNFYTASNAAPRLTIDASGNVGIGTTSPGTLFAVNGPGLFVGTSTIFGGLNLESISATGTLGFYTRGTAAPRAVIDSGGRLGIGTTSPSHLLTVRGPFLANSTSTIVGGGLIGQGLFSTTSLAFYTNSNLAPRLFIEGGGNIGVGTTGPQANLAVTTTAGAMPFLVGSSTGSYIVVDEFGGVGVGGRVPDRLTTFGVQYEESATNTSRIVIGANVKIGTNAVNSVFRLMANGNIFIDGAISSPADYAELL